MTFNLNDYIPQLNNWFKTEIKYEGRGRAEFLKPRGWVEGHTVVEFDEAGDANILMEIEDSYCEEPLGTKHKHVDLVWLLNGRMPTRHGDSVAHAIGLEPQNKCTSLTIRTPDGVFETLDENPYYGFFFPISRIKFSILRSQFRSQSIQHTKYWVLPLSNFVADVPMPRLGRHPLNWHPLRLYRVPRIPSDFQEEHEEIIAVGTANSSNKLITFMYNKKFGFIEFSTRL